MFVRTKAVVLILMVMIGSLSAGVIPNDLQWPIKNKGVADTSIFFDTEDAVDTPNGKARKCNDNGDRDGFSHFDRHAGYDIIANIGAKVFPVDDGIIVKIGLDDDGWKSHVVVEHNNNGKKWTSVYWHLQNGGLINQLGDFCKNKYTYDFFGNRSNNPDYKERYCKVTKTTILGYIGEVTNMNDVNHLHLGIRPLSYDKKSVLGFGKGKNLHNFVDPLKYLPHSDFDLIDDAEARYYKKSWKQSNKLDMYSGVGYKETSAYWNDSLAILYYGKNTDYIGKYKIYAKFPVSSKRSEKSYYLLYINRKLVGGKKINQSDFKNRGHNVLFFNGTFKKGDEIIILTANASKNKYMSSDALLFIKQ